MRAIAFALLLAACSGERSFNEPVVLGGRSISPDVLNRGEFAYMRYCRGCHGQHGEADGPYASTLAVPPRDLTRGEYPRISPGALPTDEQLDRLIREGIPGTPMVPLGISADERHDVVQYIKTLAPIWR